MGMPDYRLLSSDTERIPLRNRVQSLYYKLRTKVFPFDLWPRCNFSTQVPNERGKTGIYILQYGPRTGHKIAPNTGTSATKFFTLATKL